MLREGEFVVLFVLVLAVAPGTVLEVAVVVVAGAVALLVGTGEAGRALRLLLLFAVVAVVVVGAVLLVTFEPPLTAVPRLTPSVFVASIFSYFSLKLAG